MPLLKAPGIPDTRKRVTALLLRICSVLESCSTVSRLDLRDRVEATLKLYSARQASDVSHMPNGFFNNAESVDLACVLAGLVHHSGVAAVNRPLPRKAPGEAAVAILRSKLDAYVAWKETKEAPPVAQSTPFRPSNVAGFFMSLPKTTNTHQRPHSTYGYNTTQRRSYATFASSAPLVAFFQSSHKRSLTRRPTCPTHLSPIKEPENDHPNGSPVFFPEWSPYRPPESKTTHVMMKGTNKRDPLALSLVNSCTASLPA
jgi:hypothetical protein